jgi:ribosome biogenesis GTPase / thiamine phosphate phosphatase
VRSEDGSLYRCRARGRLKKVGATIIVGDHADFTPLAAGEGVLEAILPRRSLLKRPNVANVDQVIMVCSPQDPPLALQLLDRLLVLAEIQGLHSVICMNKQDLSQKDELNMLRAIYWKAGYPVIGTSAKKSQGIEQFREFLRGRISVLAGPSGVGKSTLLNCMQEGLTLKTGRISEKMGRGRHTTTHTELIPLNHGGLVVDTPGFSQLDLEGLSVRDLANCYPEFDQFSANCRFNGCVHMSEPGCAVKDAVNTGDVPSERYHNYLVFMDEVSAPERRH